MKIKDILKKIASEGLDKLTKEEKDFMDAYEDADENARIPKERLDREISKRKDIEKKLDEATANAVELNSRLEEIETKGLPEKDKLAKESAKLAKQIEALTAERDAHKAELDGVKYQGAIAKLADEHSFSDSEYLAFQLKAKKIAVDDTEAVKTFMGDLKKNSPKLFKAEGQPGGGTQHQPGGTGTPPANAKFEEAKKSGDTLAMLAAAPEIKA